MVADTAGENVVMVLPCHTVEEALVNFAQQLSWTGMTSDTITSSP